jgi:predicted GNAT family N-acyltransferase
MYSLLGQNNGTLLVGHIDNKKVSYCFLSHGVHDTNFRRIKYFAVERDCRNQNIGTNTIKSIIDNECSISSGITLACHPNMKKFYEKIGFVFFSNASYGENQIVLSMVSPLVNISSKKYAVFFDFKVDNLALVSSFYHKIKLEHAL